MAENLNQKTKKLVERSHATVQARRRTANSSTLKTLENQGTDIMRKQKAASEFYRFVSEFKVGMGVDDGKSAPNLDQFRDKLQEKLADLVVGDSQYAKEIAKELVELRCQKEIVETTSA